MCHVRICRDIEVEGVGTEGAQAFKKLWGEMREALGNQGAPDCEFMRAPAVPASVPLPTTDPE